MRSTHFVLVALAFICSISLAASAQTTYAYTANTLDSTISIYKLNTTTGALAQISTSPFAADSPAYLASASGGKFLVASGGECPDCGLEVYAINTTTGALTFKDDFDHLGSIDFLVGQIASDATGNTIYAQGSVQGGGAEGVIDALHVNADGTLTQVGTPFIFGPGIDPSGVGPLAVDPQGRWVFTIITDGNTQQQQISEIPRNADGSLGNIDSGISLTVQKCNNSDILPLIAIDPQGKNLFVSCNPSGASTFEGIQVYGIDQTTGALSRVDSFTTAHSFEALTVDRQGWRLFSVTEESNLVEPFDFDRNTDQLGLLNGGILYHTGAQPNGVAVDPANKFVYVTNGSFCFPKQVANGNCTNSSSNNITGFSFNYTQGTLTALAGSPFVSGKGTRSMIFVTQPQ